VLTSPTAACYNNLPDGEDELAIGRKLRFFGDGFQSSKTLGDRKLWRIPVMEGEFVCDDAFKITKAVGGGNFLIMGQDTDSVLTASERAVEAIRDLPNVITPFPGGVVRSGSKVGSKYPFLIASTNDPYCPTLRSVTDSALPEGVNSVMEIVVDGLNEDSVKEAMREGIKAATSVDGILKIGAGNYGGDLGKYHIQLHEILEV